ncbi:uncharacterized protein ACA1_064990 [Acanthamoeba castellanii str. Neff]|uniref:Uncharacterized protein n=1 Tax=Acanthamoeba castellanii (strain ATCC 30010 / Neff) TaxID=1257118 RepID=L8GXP6_ACACF|nr:uncharacterized protein ACA1_064990 [Acanthamoeba castellanii str. Neff]ELR17712.1 hypothetical protein ACA1_064990 [Acanthamoeba castellanii str. Neff]
MKASGGLDEKEGVTWYRPIPPPGYAVAGDVVRPYLAASPRFYLEAPVFAIGPFPPEAAQRPGAVMADRKRSAAGLRAKREVLPRQPVNYLAKPVDFEVVWRHEGGVRGMLPCTVWRPVPPPSFVAVGCIITLTHNKPSPDCVVCLHESLVVPAEVDALLWTASASPASAAATNKKGRTLTRAKSERDVTAHTTATFLFGDAEEVYDGLAPPALTGAAYCLRRSVNHSLDLDHNFDLPAGVACFVPARFPFVLLLHAAIALLVSFVVFFASIVDECAEATAISGLDGGDVSSPSAQRLESPAQPITFQPGLGILRICCLVDGCVAAESSVGVARNIAAAVEQARHPHARSTLHRRLLHHLCAALALPPFGEAHFTIVATLFIVDTSQAKLSHLVARASVTISVIIFVAAIAVRVYVFVFSTPRVASSAPVHPSNTTSIFFYIIAALALPAHDDRRYTIGAAGDEYECPRCHGHKGQGPFGPCPLGSIHFTHMCELCEGRGSVAGPSELCRLCEGEGGFGEFGKCRPESLHFRACVKCHGRGFLSARGHSS